MKNLSVRILIGNLICASVFACFVAVPVTALAAGPSEMVPARDGATDSRADRLSEQQARSAQQKKDLRQALQLQQGKGGDVADPRPLASRHLSAQERAEMRQQLRQQRRDAERNKP